jgi:hypothetical protein
MVKVMDIIIAHVRLMSIRGLRAGNSSPARRGRDAEKKESGKMKVKSAESNGERRGLGKSGNIERIADSGRNIFQTFL